MALLGCVDEISRARVFGWAMNTERPRDGLEIIVFVDGQEHSRGIADRLRKGLKEHLGGDATGFYEFDIKLSPSLSVFRGFKIEVVVSGTENRLPGWQRELAVPKPSGGRFTPVLLTSTGRSGTTFLMGELGRHRQIVSADIYPYEVKLVAYYSAAYRALVPGEDRVNSTDPHTMFDNQHSSWIGHNPYNNPGLFSVIKKRAVMEELFEGTIPLRLSEMFQKNIEDYYALIKRDHRKTGAAFFIEKGEIDQAAREGARLFFSHVREIVLVRDPRDMLCSAKAFWNLSSAEAIEMMTTTLPRIEEIRHAADPDSFFVRYEDLVLEPTETRLSLTRFIGVSQFENSASEQELDKDFQASHGTSVSAGASIGRWENDLTQEEIRECEGLFGSYMELFGYSSSDNRRAHSNDLNVFKGSRAISRLQSDVVSNDGSPLHPVLDIGFQAGCLSEPYLVQGWFRVEQEYVWSSRTDNVLHFNRPSKQGKFRLRLVGRPFVVEQKLSRQRLKVSINGKDFGEVQLNGYSIIECDLPWDLIALADKIVIRLECPDAAQPNQMDPKVVDDRLLGFALERLTVFGTNEIIPLGAERRLESIPGAASPGLASSIDEEPMSKQYLMLQFESLGENCEFGLVQRKCDVEPLGLFRFSSAPLEKLLAGLRTEFDGMGSPGNIEIQVSPNGHEYMVLDKRFGFLYHAWVLVGEMTPQEVELRETRRLPLLVRKLVDTLKLNEKIFVYHGMSPLELIQARELSVVLRTYGPTTLLWVELADDAHAPGTVEEIEPGLLKGYMDRFAPGENAHDLSLDCWISLCRNAYRLWKRAEPAA